MRLNFGSITVKPRINNLQIRIAEKHKERVEGTFSYLKQDLSEDSFFTNRIIYHQSYKSNKESQTGLCESV